MRIELKFEEIVSNSDALTRVLAQLDTVAPSDSTVLIYGETETGKELIARAIRNLTSRKVERLRQAELRGHSDRTTRKRIVGHEEGAFTGAIAQRVGRGRVGESRPSRDGRGAGVSLRSLLPVERFPRPGAPLRERREDIPLLVRHFVQQFSRMTRSAETIPSETMKTLVRYDWPGNIRELQNVIERAVIVSTGPVPNVPLDDLKARVSSAEASNGDSPSEDAGKDTRGARGYRAQADFGPLS